MKMKNAQQTIFLLLLILCIQPIFAQNIVETNANLDEAIIYVRGAELRHEAKNVQIPSGNSEVVINRVAKNINPQSIRVLSTNSQISILSVSFERDYLNKNTNKSSLYLENKKKYDHENKIYHDLVNQRKAEESTLALLEANKDVGGQNGVTPTEITNMIKYYRAQFKEISDRIVHLKSQEEKQKAIVDKLKQQMDESGGDNQNAGQLVLRVSTPQAANVNFDIQYFTNNVSWTPFYELRVDNIQSPVQLLYKANVVQTTGIDWKQVPLTFAGGNPQQNNNVPELKPWRLSYRSAVVSPRPKKLMIRGTNASAERFQEVAPASEDMAVVQDNQLNTSFVIDVPYDVYSNGQAQAIQLQSYTLNTTYSYTTVPKYSSSAYLIGKITDWNELNLLPGNANLIVENNYAGTSYINPHSTNDTLTLSLGKDERIVATRERIDEEGSRSFLGNSQSREYTYEISLRNSRQQAVDVEVKEQYPLSNEKDIEITVNETSGAVNNPEEGELTWNVHLKPGETKKLRFSYTVKYPKGKTPVGL